MVLCGLLAASGAQAASAAPCAATQHRRLLQSPASPANAASGPIIETVEVDVVSQECIMLMNSYYDAAALGVVELAAPSANQADSARDCCALCHDSRTSCNAFQWCPEAQGCNLGSVSFPYRGCQLLDLSGYLNASVNTGAIKQDGPGVPFTAGSPLFFSVPKLSGYDVDIGRNFGGKFNYTCAGSMVEKSCVIAGSAQEVSVACNADPLCLAFTWYPSGAASRPQNPLGVLKGGGNVQLSSNDTELNPYAAIYIKLQPYGASASGDGGGGPTTVVIAVVASVVGVAAVAMAVLAVFDVRYRRLKASVADGRAKPAADGDSPGDDGEGSGDTPGLDLSSAGGASSLAAAGGHSPAGSYSSQCEDEAALGRSGSPPLAMAASSGSGSGCGVPPGYTPFMLLSPHHMAPHTGANVEVAVVDVSRSSSGGSRAAPAADGWAAAPNGSWGAAAAGDGWEASRASPAAGAAALPLVVEVARTVGNPTSCGRGELPPSLQQAGTARELLEVFARMYSQRPAVDYAVVAQMLDQDADPGDVSAAERADEEALRRADAAAAQRRAASRTPSAQLSGSSGPPSGPRSQLHAATLHAALQQQQQALQQQQQQGSYALPPAGAEAGAVQGLAALPGSAQLEQEQSLLPGMAGSEAASSMLPPSEWSLQPEEVEICKRPDGTYWQLGTGAFGTCYKGLYHGSMLVAVKVLHRVESRRRGEEFEREVGLLKQLHDRNIVQFIGACLDGPAPMLVTEFLEFGDLWRALPLTNPGGQRIFAWYKRGRRLLFDVAKGLHYLHQRRIVHLDLKSANILLSRHGTAKICDIGMARVLGNKNYLSMLSGMGTFAWSAPEVLAGKRCTEKVDLYSFGVVIWEVCTGDVPVRGEMRALCAPADCPPEVVALYERCISEDPEQRPTAAELLQQYAAPAVQQREPARSAPRGVRGVRTMAHHVSSAVAALLTLIMLQGAAAAGQGTAETRPCGALPAAVRHRHLLHDALGPSPPPATAAVNDPSSQASNGTFINQLVDQKCSMMHRALVSGTVLQPGDGNLQPDEVSCCQSCLAGEGCTAWVYCPEPLGCSAEGSRAGTAQNGTAAAAPAGSATPPGSADQRRLLQLPFQGCRLLSIPAFKLQRDSPQILVKGPEVQFVSGTPVSFDLPILPGYSVRTGKETVFGLGYQCEESLLLHSCLLKGLAEELAAICDADPLCKAFVYLPGGVDSLSEPVGIFKGGAGVESIDISSLLPNPSTATYIKDGAVSLSGGSSSGGPLGASGGGGGSGTNALWIVLPTVLAVALAAAAAVAVYASLAMRRQARRLTEAEAALAKAQSRAPRGGGDKQAPATGGSGMLTVHLLKPSPPSSGSSTGGSADGSTPRAGATSCGSADGGVPCPQCGATLGVSACRQPRQRHRHAQQQQQQQHHHQQTGQQQPQPQQVVLAATSAPPNGAGSALAPP
ncbi:serine threonine-kinase [Micractinium conductrix]|uniref:Serine threonine-kinase n=1 Tax=Micractinium conductrix TaxID=554055 RepID=A0A2P6VCG7_9CHLO|nr:serine threonine-kinase [Micractinium conductrix]|eukprot:PSC71778.1 serine threonine-kinase [Micractinium conductrix]